MPVLEMDVSKNITSSYIYGANGVVYRQVHLSGDDEYHHTGALDSMAIRIHYVSQPCNMTDVILLYYIIKDEWSMRFAKG